MCVFYLYRLPGLFCKQHHTSIPLPGGSANGSVNSTSDSRIVSGINGSGVTTTVKSSSLSPSTVLSSHHPQHHSFPQNSPHGLLGASCKKSSGSGISSSHHAEKGKGLIAHGNPYNSSGKLLFGKFIKDVTCSL